MEYYDEIADSYDELYEEEQLKKIALIRSRIEVSEDEKVLDVGCGTGIAASCFTNATAIDPSKALLKIAEKKHPGPEYIAGKAEMLPFEDDSFGFVISLTAIQNFINIDEGLSEMKRVGKRFFALSFLKKSKKSGDILKKIKKMFKVIEIIDEMKDVIVIATK